MTDLSPEAENVIKAVVGWIELKNVVEAAAELKAMPAAERKHPKVLAVNWLIHTAKGEWLECEQVARRLTRLAPKVSTYWLWLAQALEKTDHTPEAYAVLSKRIGRFRNDIPLRVELARVCLAMGKKDECDAWLRRAAELTGKGGGATGSVAPKDISDQ